MMDVERLQRSTSVNLSETGLTMMHPNSAMSHQHESRDDRLPDQIGELVGQLFSARLLHILRCLLGGLLFVDHRVVE